MLCYNLKAIRNVWILINCNTAKILDNIYRDMSGSLGFQIQLCEEISWIIVAI